MRLLRPTETERGVIGQIEIWTLRSKFCWELTEREVPNFSQLTRTEDLKANTFLGGNKVNIS